MLAGTVAIPGSVWNILPAPQQRHVRTRQHGSEHQRRRSGVAELSRRHEPGGAGSARHLAVRPRLGVDAGDRHVQGVHDGRDEGPRRAAVRRLGSRRNRRTRTGCSSIEFTPTTQTTASAARTKGWVERGIFVGNRLVSLSDMSLAVVDYTNPWRRASSTELTLARNVVASRPTPRAAHDRRGVVAIGGTTTSRRRRCACCRSRTPRRPSTRPACRRQRPRRRRAAVPQRRPRLCRDQRADALAPTIQGTCRAQQVQVVDLSNGLAVPRGSISLPTDYVGLVRLGLVRLPVGRLVRGLRGRPARGRCARVPPLGTTVRLEPQLHRHELVALSRRPPNPDAPKSPRSRSPDPNAGGATCRSSATRSIRRTTSG